MRSLIFSSSYIHLPVQLLPSLLPYLLHAACYHPCSPREDVSCSLVRSWTTF